MVLPEQCQLEHGSIMGDWQDRATPGNPATPAAAELSPARVSTARV